METKISVLIPTYNRPQFLSQALESVFEQHYKNIEIIICDNSTNNQTEEVVNSFINREKYKIVYVKNKKNIGFLENIKKCYLYATGEYINYLMDDDLFHPEKIKKMVTYLDSDESIVLVTSSREAIDKNNNVIEMELTKKIFNQDTIIDGIVLGNLAQRDFINYIGEPTTVLFRKNALDEPYGIYLGKQYNNNVDIAAWLNILKKGKAVYLEKALSYYRVHESQIGASIDSYLLSGSDWLSSLEDSHKDGYLHDCSDYNIALKNAIKNISGNIFIITKNIEKCNKSTSVQKFYQKTKLFLKNLVIDNELYGDWLHKTLDNTYSDVTNDLSKEDYIKKFITTIKNNITDRKLYIWGTGSGGLKTYNLLRMMNLDVAGFIDNDSSKWGKLINNSKVYQPGSILNNDKKSSYIIIGSVYANDISLKLNSINYTFEKDYLINIFLLD